MPTINDVAKAAGVSKSTVSNVFSQKRPISEEVKEKVLEIAKELNYRPNYLARSLAIKQTKIIGLNMIGEKVKFNPFHLSFINGVLQQCYLNDYRLLINTLSNDYKEQVMNISSDPTDGEIILNPSIKDSRIEEFMEYQIPMVIIGRPPKQYEEILPSVDNDNFPAAQKATDYLLALGHRHILFCNAPKVRTVSIDREQGYQFALKQFGLGGHYQHIEYRDETRTSIEYGSYIAHNVLSQNKEISAIITDNDKVALGVYRACKELGRSIPEDLSIIAFSDGSMYSDELQPSLTTMTLNGVTLGIEAMNLLLERLENTDCIKRVTVKIELHERQSCAPMDKLQK
ncbi:LacI family DNA-binding transcriptional regulator [Halalkalibacter sp. APA_J-10(15)]|uniref:LacI family DNA-binding transcriptional regulator n=1 Tax=unclassified Halalkalibacter TaxID=2893063 RepID=UPI001FF41FA4|nr:LacI family DNA-binding transcriptional regulator [Halalkalibacter sp. APA_J-10(15)]MCK0470213.1 LacI family transcriptional regulator [Halalkalibacter sp. APA_J-10(15)]